VAGSLDSSKSTGKGNYSTCDYALADSLADRKCDSLQSNFHSIDGTRSQNKLWEKD
jgi:hypothetical protein